MAEKRLATGFKVTCGKEIDANDVVAFAVEQDLGQPDMCAVTLRNDVHQYTTTIKLGDNVEITVGDGGTPVFKGEVVGLEPVYKAPGENTLTVRAFNRLHRLLRGRKSKTYLNQSDQDIVTAIAGQHSLSPKCGSKTKITHKHIYQHNQTDLEFLRLRAARIGYEVWVEDKTLNFDEPRTDQDSGVKLRYSDSESSIEQGEIFVKYFAPRISSAGVVSSVTVRGWNPEKKEEIVGEAKAQNSSLGKTGADKAAGVFGNTVTFEVDHPIFSVEEAKAIAESKLKEAMMGYITGEGECRGAPEIKPGIVVTITANPDDAKGAKKDPFNGKYMVVGASHRYSKARGNEGGVISLFRVSRDAEGLS